MKSVSRKLALAVLVTLGAAACGDKVTVPAATTTTPRVHSVTVSPSSATVAQGSSFTFGASVDADATLARTVSWSAAGGTGITVDANGVASASATATGVASVCATSTADTGVKGCASLTVAGGAAASTVQIDAITEGCTPLNAALPGHPAVCGLLVPVQTNNVGGQIDVAVIVNRPPNSGVTGVKVDVLGGATFTTVEATYSQSLTGDFVAQSDAGVMAAQNTLQSQRIVFSIQTAAYICTIPPATAATNCASTAGTVATVTHVNGQKKLRATLVGGTQTGQAETQLTFRNANGWHINMGTLANNNGTVCGPVTALAACPVGTNSTTTGLAWKGGTSIPINALPVNYTGFVIAAGAGTNVAFGTAAPLCDVAGIGTRVAAAAVATGTNGQLSGTLNHTANSVGVAGAGNVDGYAIAPAGACAAAGESPFATGVDATGANFIPPGFALGAPFAGNVLNNVTNPVIPSYTTVVPIRLDNVGPAPINGYATGRNPTNAGTPLGAGDRCFGLNLNIPSTDGNGAACPGIAPALLVGGVGPSINATPQSAFVSGRIARMNGWMNDVVNFGAIHSNSIANAAFLFPATYTAPVAGDVAGVISPSPTPTGLPIDVGIGGAIGGVPANPITFVGRIGSCTTVATCAALTVARTTVAAQGAATALAETNGANPSGLGASPGYGAIVQTVDVFGNLTNPPTLGTAAFAANANFGSVACPAGVPNAGLLACVANPADPNNPYVDNGVLFLGVDRTLPTVTSKGGGLTGGASVVGTTTTNNTIQGQPGGALNTAGAANFFYSADDAVPAGLLGTAGILSVAPGSDLYITLSRRDGATLQYFCLTSINYQPAANACGTVTGWAASTQTYNTGAGGILSDPAASGVRAYYAISVFTRDQAGNQTSAANQTLGARDFIFDNTPPASFGATFSPGVFPANGAVTFSGTATEDLDVGRGTWSVRFPSLSVAAAAGADFIRLPWANRNVTGQLANPVGYLAAGPSSTALPLTSAAWTAMRSIEVVTVGDNAAGPAICGVPGAPTAGGGFTCGAAAGGLAFPGGLNGGGVAVAFVQDGNLAAGAGPTQFNFFTQSVSRVGLSPSNTGAYTGPPMVPLNQGTAINYGQTGMGTVANPCTGAASLPASPGYWSAVQAAGLVCNGVNNQFFNMQWAVVNPAAGNLDLSGSAATTTSKTLTAVAFGANGPMQTPFLGGVRFYAVDTRQPLNVDNAGGIPAGGQPAAAGVGAALVEIPCTGGVSIFNDQATNTWQYSCAYSPSTGGAASMLQAHDFEGFHFPSSANLAVNWVAGVATPNGAAVPNQGFWGSGQVGPTAIATVNGWQSGWQGGAAIAAVAAATNVPVIAIGCNVLGYCLATRLNTNVGFNVQP